MGAKERSAQRSVLGRPVTGPSPQPIYWSQGGASINSHELIAETARAITHRPQVFAAYALPQSARALGNRVSKSITLAHVGVTRIRANRCPRNRSV
jgi:hypothetical protein